MDDDISENPTINCDRSLTMKLALELNSFIVPLYRQYHKCMNTLQTSMRCPKEAILFAHQK